MRRIIAALFLAGAACFAQDSAAAAENATPPAACVSHPTMTLADYLALTRDYVTPESKALKALPTGDYSRFVPKDFKIENRPVRYAPAEYTVYSQPLPYDRQEFGDGELRRDGYVFTSPCRVEDSQGRRWVVEHESDRLLYFAAASVKTEAEAYRPHQTSNPFDLPDMSARAAGPCMPGKTFAELKGRSDDFRNFTAADFKKTPRDLESANGAESYVTTAPVMPRILPDGGAWPLRELPEGAGLVSACRVRGVDGAQWAAYRSQDGALGYVPLTALRAGAGKDLEAARFQPGPRRNSGRLAQTPDVSPAGRAVCVAGAASMAEMTARSGDKRRWADSVFKKPPSDLAI